MLTRRGRALLTVAILVYAAGVMLGYVELVVLAAAPMLALGTGVLWILRSPNLEVTRVIAPSRVSRGSPAFGELRITNPNSLASAPLRVLESCGSKDILVDVPRLGPSAGTVKRYRLPTDRRGVFLVGPLRMTRSDPLGLWRKARQLGGFDKLWVHPLVHELAGMPAGRIKSLDGLASNRVTQGGVAFHALREYQRGDDLRMVHWRSTARTGTLMVRENLETSLPQITVLVDTRASSHDADSFEEVIEAAASVLSAASRSQLPVRLLTSCGRAASGRGPARAGSLLDTLAELGLSTATVPLKDQVSRLGIQRGGDTLVILTGAPSPTEIVVLAGLTRRYDDAVMGFVTPKAQEIVLPPGVNVRSIRVESAGEFSRSWISQVLR